MPVTSGRLGAVLWGAGGRFQADPIGETPASSARGGGARCNCYRNSCTCPASAGRDASRCLRHPVGLRWGHARQRGETGARRALAAWALGRLELRRAAVEPAIDLLAMKHLFWLIPDRLAGRPGPDRAPWNLAAMRAAGVGAVLSVNDGLLCHPEDFRAHGIAYACVPLSDNAPPQPGDEEACLHALPRAYAFVHEQLSAGHATVVHCSSGKDRTGLFLAYYLMREGGLSAAIAIEEVRRVRPIAFTAPGWDEHAVGVLRRVS